MLLGDFGFHGMHGGRRAAVSPPHPAQPLRIRAKAFGSNAEGQKQWL